MNAKQYRKNNLSFPRDIPSNSDIVNYFTDRLDRNGNGKVTASDKCEAITIFGYLASFAGMMRAFRKYRRTH